MLSRIQLTAGTMIRKYGSFNRRLTAGVRLDPMLENIISRFSESAKAGNLMEDKSKKLVDDFNKLQAYRVQRVLLVCSDYDSTPLRKMAC